MPVVVLRHCYWEAHEKRNLLLNGGLETKYSMPFLFQTTLLVKSFASCKLSVMIVSLYENHENITLTLAPLEIIKKQTNVSRKSDLFMLAGT